MAEFLTTDDGRWTPAAVHQRKPLVEEARWSGFRGRAWVLSNGNVVLATARRRPHGTQARWIVHILGHEYLVTPEMAASRIWPLGSYISVKACDTAEAAKREVLRVLRAMPCDELAE